MLCIKPRHKTTISVFERLFCYLQGYRIAYVTGAFLSTLQIASSFILPFVLSSITTIVTGEVAEDNLHVVFILLTILLVLTPFICWGNYLKATNAARAHGALREAVFDHLQRLPVSLTMEQRTGDYITLMTSDLERASSLYTNFAMTSLFRFVIIFPLALISLLIRDWRIGLFGFVMTSLSVIMSTRLNPKVRELNREAQEQIAASATPLMELIRGAEILRVFNLEERLAAQYQEICLNIYDTRIRFRFLNGLVDAILLLFQAAAQPAAFLVGIVLLLRGNTSIATIVFSATMVGTMADAMQSLSRFLNGIQPAVASAVRVFDVLDMPQEEERETIEKPDLMHEIAVEFTDICFCYAEDREVLNRLSFSVPRGQTIALVGGSGGGKTTVFKLLQDFYSPQSGEIRLFGRNLHELSRTDLRQCMAYVSQDAPLFAGTIGENIAWGRPNASIEDIRLAAKASMIGDYIDSLPLGYDTPVGERGMALSGGQRQRIAIARAFLKNSPLLLLDEATSSLDSENERSVGRALASLMEGRTTIVVAHRLATIRQADEILVLEAGNIVERGDHDALMAIGGRYADLIQLQYGQENNSERGEYDA